MEHNYLLNPAISLLCEQIERGSKEQEVQALWETLLWTVFPANDHWMTRTKYKQGATEPDNMVSKLLQFNTGWATIDVLTVELKRPREKVTLEAFNTVARDLLDDHMSESNNPDGTTLFGAVGIGHHVVFYHKKLPHGNLTTTQTQPFHILTDVARVQEYFYYHKSNIPQPPSPGAAPNPAPPPMGQSSHAYGSSTTSYYAPESSRQAPGSSYEAPASSYHAPESSHQASASSHQAPGSSYEAPTSSYYQAPASSHPAPEPSDPAPAPDYQEGGNEYTEGDLETQQADTMGADQYIAVEVRKERHLTSPDLFFFIGKNGKERETTRDDWHRTRASSGHRCWIYHRKYVCYQDIFRK
jgi:hypothetical protein